MELKRMSTKLHEAYKEILNVPKTDEQSSIRYQVALRHAEKLGIDMETMYLAINFIDAMTRLKEVQNGQ